MSLALFQRLSERAGRRSGWERATEKGLLWRTKESLREREDIEAVVGRTHVSAMDKIKRLRNLHYVLVPEKLHQPSLKILFFFFFFFKSKSWPSICTFVWDDLIFMLFLPSHLRAHVAPLPHVALQIRPFDDTVAKTLDQPNFDRPIRWMSLQMIDLYAIFAPHVAPLPHVALQTRPFEGTVSEDSSHETNYHTKTRKINNPRVQQIFDALLTRVPWCAGSQQEGRRGGCEEVHRKVVLVCYTVDCWRGEYY